MGINNFILRSKNIRTMNKILLNLLKENDLYQFFESSTIRVKRQLTSILKSPHVNKTAQEQFEFKLIKKKMKVLFSNSYLYFYLIKKIIESSVSDALIQIGSTIDGSLSDKLLLTYYFNPDKRYLNRIQKKLMISSDISILPESYKKQRYLTQKIKSYDTKKTKKILQVFDVYGESHHTFMKV